MTNFILIEVVEREISTPEFFNTYKEAFQEMKRRFNICNKHDGYIDDWSAWCENANHDNCDWKIFEMEVK